MCQGSGWGGKKKKRQENKIITHAEQPFLAGLLAVKNLLVCPETAPEHPKNGREEPSRRLLCQLLASGAWAFLLPPALFRKTLEAAISVPGHRANTFEALLLVNGNPHNNSAKGKKYPSMAAMCMQDMGKGLSGSTPGRGCSLCSPGRGVGGSRETADTQGGMRPNVRASLPHLL